MSLYNMLKSNGYKPGSKEFKAVYRDLRKVSKIIHDIGVGFTPCTTADLHKITNIINKYENLQGDLGYCDIHDLAAFIEKSVSMLDKNLIATIFRDVIYKNEFNPKH